MHLQLETIFQQSSDHLLPLFLTTITPPSYFSDCRIGASDDVKPLRINPGWPALHLICLDVQETQYLDQREVCAIKRAPGRRPEGSVQKTVRPIRRRSDLVGFVRRNPEA